MLDTLQKMSGTTHRTYTDSKTITRDTKAILDLAANEGKVSYTMTTKEEPVISYNDMAFISERNSIVFRAGDPPIWNRNETILPMSWRLFKNTITQPGKDYTLQTIPTLSTAMDFDVRKNQPNFSKMLEKRMTQAEIAEKAAKMYQDAYGYSDYEVEQLDPDNYADELMDLICSTLNPEEAKAAMEAESAGKKDDVPDSDQYEEMFDYIFGNQDNKRNNKFTDVKLGHFDEFTEVSENKEQRDATAMAMHQQEDGKILRYADKTISRDMLVSFTGVSHGLDTAILKVYTKIKQQMDDDSYFSHRNNNLYGARDGQLYIKDCRAENAADLAKIRKAAEDPDSRVFDNNALPEGPQKEDPNIPEDERDKWAKDHPEGAFRVTDAFITFLASFPKEWPFVDGEFAKLMRNEMTGGETDDEFSQRLKMEASGRGQKISGDDNEDAKFMLAQRVQSDRSSRAAQHEAEKAAKAAAKEAKKAAKAAKRGR